MIKKLPALFIITTALFINTAKAQTANNSIEVSPFYGVQIFSIAQYKMIGNFYGAEAAFHLSMANNQADWVRMLNVKDITFVASYRKLDNIYLARRPGSEGVLGNTIGASARLSIQLVELGSTRLMFYPGFGAGYVTEKFQTTGNPLTGSNLNFAISTGLKLVTPVTKTTRLMYGVDIYHYSNGALRLPNEGVNTFNTSIGIDHNIDGQGPKTSKHPFIYNKSSFEFGINLGRRGLVQSGAGLTGDAGVYQKLAASRLFNTGVYAGYNYRVNPVFSLKATTDAVYSYTKFDYDNFYATFQERATSFDRVRWGAGLGADMWMGRAAIEASYGYYIHFNSYYPEKWYWTIGAKYFVSTHFAVEGKLYLHGTEANYTGYGILYRL